MAVQSQSIARGAINSEAKIESCGASMRTLGWFGTAESGGIALTVAAYRIVVIATTTQLLRHALLRHPGTGVDKMLKCTIKPIPLALALFLAIVAFTTLGLLSRGSPVRSQDKRLALVVVSVSPTPPSIVRYGKVVAEQVDWETAEKRLNYPLAAPKQLPPGFSLSRVELLHSVIPPDHFNPVSETITSSGVEITYSNDEGAIIALRQYKPDVPGPIILTEPIIKDVQINGTRFVARNMGISVVQPFIEWTDGTYHFAMWGGNASDLDLDAMLEIAASVTLE